MKNTLSRKEAERRRMLAITLLEDGLTQTHVAQILGVSDAAISQWIKAKRKGGGIVALKAKPPPGVSGGLRGSSPNSTPNKSNVSRRC